MNLNDKQQKIVIFGVVLFALMGFFPPWTYTVDTQQVRRERPAGYALIISPPEPEGNAVAYGVRIDVSRIVIQWLVLVAATGLGVIVTRSHDNK